MNKRERKALALHKRNREYVEANIDAMHWRELAAIAKQQDEFWLMAYRRMDKRILSGKGL